MTSLRIQFRGRWRFLVLVWCAAASTAVLRAARVAGHDLKAVFLYQFAQFVDWPPEAFASPDAPFVIGRFGPDSLGVAIEEVVRNEIINLGAARAAQLTISSKLLRAADVVNRRDLGLLSWASDRYRAD